MGRKLSNIANKLENPLEPLYSTSIPSVPNPTPDASNNNIKSPDSCVLDVKISPLLFIIFNLPLVLISILSMVPFCASEITCVTGISVEFTLPE